MAEFIFTKEKHYYGGLELLQISQISQMFANGISADMQKAKIILIKIPNGHRVISEAAIAKFFLNLAIFNEMNK